MYLHHINQHGDSVDYLISALDSILNFTELDLESTTLVQPVVPIGLIPFSIEKPLFYVMMPDESDNSAEWVDASIQILV